jgi:hypothetical protein
MKTRWSRAGLLSATCGAALATASRASACGGCFHQEMPAAETTVVTGHRMAFAISDERTVLWDQIQYAGPPADFSWVLPVRPGSYVESSRDAWFESLDAVTATRVNAPTLNCAQPDPSPGCGCGSVATLSASGLAEGGDVDDNGVTVIHQGTVGPYATVTLQSDDGDTLTAWLAQNGYSVPPDIAPVISEYVTEGFDFIALRLLPGAGVEQMTPVRVMTPGPPGPLPLRMVKAGVGAYVGITLYVIGEGRYALPDLSETTLATEELVWDFSAGRSNYADLREDALSENFGYSYLTTFADRGAFVKTYDDAKARTLSYFVSSPTGTNNTTARAYTNLADLYFAQAAANDGTAAGACQNLYSVFADTRVVESAPTGDELGAPQFTCGKYDDLGAAVVGMHPANVWLNRLELDLPRDALNADCTVTLNSSQESVSNELNAVQTKNRPSTCAQPIFQNGLGGSSHREELGWLGVLGLVACSRLRRRAR